MRNLAWWQFMWLIIKDDQLRDNPPNPQYGLGHSSDNSFLPIYNFNRPEVHAVVAEMRNMIDRYSGLVPIGEIYHPLNDLITYYGRDLKGANLPFNFLLLRSAWNAQSSPRLIRIYKDVAAGGVVKLGLRES